MARREASVMNSPYSASRTRSFASLSAWTVCVRCVIQVVTMVAAAPTRDPQAAAIAVMRVESMDSGTGVQEQNIHVRHAWPDYREVFGAGSLSASEKGAQTDVPSSPVRPRPHCPAILQGTTATATVRAGPLAVSVSPSTRERVQTNYSVTGARIAHAACSPG